MSWRVTGGQRGSREGVERGGGSMYIGDKRHIWVEFGLGTRGVCIYDTKYHRVYNRTESSWVTLRCV